jgi:hypothetical protein
MRITNFNYTNYALISINGGLMKNKIKYLLFISILLVFTTSCSTTETTVIQPYAASVSFPSEDNYEILGRVNYSPSYGTGGYIEFLEYAKTVYPSTDDIVNIIVDSEDTYEDSVGMYGSSTSLIKSMYTMSGIAIKYID